MKLCECGCGNPAPVANENDKRFGWIKGQPKRFIHGHHRRANPASQFWSKVEKTDNCWKWHGSKTILGYGQLRIDYRLIAAHRFSYEMHYGPIPPKKHVLHSCDNPECTRPDHLHLGTHQDNMQEAVERDRFNHKPRIWGEKHHLARLTEDNIKEIRAMFPKTAGRKKYGSISSIATRFSVSTGAIQSILNGITWKHVK